MLLRDVFERLFFRCMIAAVLLVKKWSSRSTRAAGRVRREKIGFMDVNSTPLAMLAQTFRRAKRRKRRRILTDRKILFYSRLCTRFLRRVRRPKMIVVILDGMPLRASTLVRLVRYASGRIDGIKRFS